MAPHVTDVSEKIADTKKQCYSRDATNHIIPQKRPVRHLTYPSSKGGKCPNNWYKACDCNRFSAIPFQNLLGPIKIFHLNKWNPKHNMGLISGFEKELKLMGNFMWLPAIAAIESFLRVFAYITIIIIGFKMVKALNNYNDKNPK